MNLLIIGNGFDLAHGFKTTYTDFLEWAYLRGKMSMYNGFSLGNYWYFKEIATQKERDSITVEMYTPSFANELFKKCDKWIDLENNMATVLKMLSEAPLSKYEHDRSTFKALFDEFLLPAFEDYIVNEIHIQSPTKKYKLENVDLVLSFNYSDTFERLYSRKVDICYLNGKAEADEKNPHIVFGYDYTPNPNLEKREYLWHYDKAYQRAYKNTSSKYKEWMKRDAGLTIHLFGHSLGVTDHDILLPLMQNSKNKTIVYYHDELSHQQLIYKVIEMVGKAFYNQNQISFLPTESISNMERSYGKIEVMKRPF